MKSYEAPAITELGSIADFTRGDWFAAGWDGKLFRGNDHDPSPAS